MKREAAYKIAVIMRTKDRSVFLERGIQSVIGQSYKDWVLVIVNDGGDCEEVNRVVASFSEALAGRVVVIHNEMSRGMEAASNKGIQAVDSKYVVIHDDDDTWKEDFLMKTVTYLEQHQSCYGVITQSNKVIEEVKNETLQVKKVKPFNTQLKGMIDMYELCSKNLFPPISFVYRRSVYEEIGLYDEALPVLGDWDFNLRFIRKYNIHVIEEPLANYHHRYQVKHGQYSNSIIGGKQKHLYYETLLKNKFLRLDLDEGKLGMGMLINMAKGIHKGNSLQQLKSKLRR